ncbi:TonB-dependent siderophore receptor [Methylibium rhizosphaerae]|uniref:TonB-dependent siderophore receptor n=1 Tax=Methylibium rhizosphaerae TaxID=2570323 RepID=UPI0011299AAB|nr:TonB-dependent siderophore receptor [Methylibium rhizosphaerae]
MASNQTTVLQRPAPLLLAVLALFAAQARSQSNDLPSVTVTGRSPESVAGVGGFGDIPLSRLPLQATVVSSERLADSGTRTLADITRFDASLGDAYNSEGYWSNFTIRGFAIDNRYNYRRDGLPINAETSIGLENKSRIEVLKGTSGIQAGTSAPGGLVNLVVKRPEGAMRSVGFGWRQHNTFGAWADIGQRFGENDAFGLRVNAAHEELDPHTRQLEGRRSLLAAAGDWRVNQDTQVEAEVEWSRQTQPSVPGMSLLGNSLPDASRFDPRTNMNNQPWSQPVVLEGTTASLRLQQRLSESWRAVAHYGSQQLGSDDRLAFAYGCSAEGNFDRYCSDGTYDLYDYRSDNERRRTHALDLALQGKVKTAGIEHDLGANVLFTRFKARFRPQAFNRSFALSDFPGDPPSGVGNVNGTLITRPAPEMDDPSTNRDERSTELYLRDAIALTPRWNAWIGLRHTRLERRSVLTDGTEPTDYAQSVTTPWLALSHAFTPELMGYASWGRGVESEVVPNRDRYTNQGQALPALKSRQFEFGIKGSGTPLAWSVTAFEIERPRYANVGSDCFDDTLGDTCTRQPDGHQRHRGLEAEAEVKLGALALQAGTMLLDAKNRGVTSNLAIDSKRPVNVPRRTLKVNATYRVDALPGLSATAGLVHEGERMVLQDNSVSIPGWTRLDAGVRYEHRVASRLLTWRLGVDNLTDKRAWKESPLQFDHVYLYPLQPRTWRISLQADL